MQAYIVVTAVRTGNPYSGIPQLLMEAYGPFKNKTAAQQFAEARPDGGNVIPLNEPTK